MSKIAFVLALIALPFIAKGQDGVLEPNSGILYKKVMVIPYHPNNYISDSDQDIVKFLGKDSKGLQDKFREGLDEAVNKGVRRQYDAYSFLDKPSKTSDEDLKDVYRNISYKYDTTTSYYMAEEAQDSETIFPTMKKRIERYLSKRGHRNELVAVSDEAIEVQYMHADIKDLAVIQSVAQNYDADLYVFINQLEVKINYNNCIDLANNNYAREFRMHFSIYDSQGNLLYGDVAKAVFPSNNNDPDMIMQNSFPLMAKFLTDKLPSPFVTSEN
jgi:hypothetical protein